MGGKKKIEYNSVMITLIILPDRICVKARMRLTGQLHRPTFPEVTNSKSTKVASYAKHRVYKVTLELPGNFWSMADSRGFLTVRVIFKWGEHKVNQIWSSKRALNCSRPQIVGFYIAWPRLMVEKWQPDEGPIQVSGSDGFGGLADIRVSPGNKQFNQSDGQLEFQVEGILGIGRAGRGRGDNSLQTVLFHGRQDMLRPR
jgi:hypothetical protein